MTKSTETFLLSVIIHTKNSEKTLLEALESVAFAEQIVVVDMKSEDDSMEIAKRFTKEIYQVEDVGYVEPVRQFGISKAKHDWVLILDADEYLEDGLKVFIQSVVSKESTDGPVAYKIPRKNIMFGQELRHTGWWPDYQLRFFHKGSVTWPKEIHAKPVVKGEIKEIKADPTIAIVHYNYNSVTEFVDRFNKYSTITAENADKKLPVQSASSLMGVFTEEFTRRMFFWNGVQDTTLGLSMSLLQSTAEFVTHMKRWEANKFRDESSEEETIQALEEHVHTMNYWIADWHVKHSSGLEKLKWMMRRRRSGS